MVICIMVIVALCISSAIVYQFTKGEEESKEDFWE